MALCCHHIIMNYLHFVVSHDNIIKKIKKNWRPFFEFLQKFGTLSQLENNLETAGQIFTIFVFLFLQVEDRKREAILNRIATQDCEERTLAACRGELLRDRAVQYGRLFKNRRSLEDDWGDAIHNKVMVSGELHFKMKVSFIWSRKKQKLWAIFLIFTKVLVVQ